MATRCMWCGADLKVGHKSDCKYIKDSNESVDACGNVLITHNDLDGAGCSIIFTKITNSKHVFYEDYTTIDNRIMSVINTNPNSIIIADISPTKQETIDAISASVRNGMNIVVIDHHKTADERIGYLPWAYIDQTVCGTKALFYYLHNYYVNSYVNTHPELSPFVDIVDDYDRWIHSNPNSMRMNTLFRVYGMETFVIRCIERTQPQYFNAIDELLIDIRTLEEETYAVNAIKCSEIWDSAHGRVCIVFAERQQSLIGERCRSNNIDCDYVAIVDLHGRKVSLRSVKKGFDVCSIAKLSGGGGHVASAGFEIPYNDVMKVVEAMWL